MAAIEAKSNCPHCHAALRVSRKGTTKNSFSCGTRIGDPEPRGRICWKRHVALLKSQFSQKISLYEEVVQLAEEISLEVDSWLMRYGFPTLKKRLWKLRQDSKKHETIEPS